MQTRFGIPHRRKAPSQGTPLPSCTARVDWVDYAKGICIVMVVMMHSTLGVEAAAGHEGFMHLFVAFAKPFRMPDFFLISGLFLPRVIDRDWRLFLDRKVVHFAYFYLLWVTIQFALKAPGLAAGQGGWDGVAISYLEAFVEPFGTLWFIYLLPIFFVVTKLLRSAPPALVWAIAAVLQMAGVATGWTAIDEFCARFVYFYSGYLFSAWFFAAADVARRRTGFTVGTLGSWAIAEALCVYTGVSEKPGISLVLGFAGALAVILTGNLLAQSRYLPALRYCGKHSIVIYLAFFLPMAATREALLRSGLIPDAGWMSLTVTVAALLGALSIWWTVRGTRLDFLFTRPDRLWLTPRRLAPALAA